MRHMLRSAARNVASPSGALIMAWLIMPLSPGALTSLSLSIDNMILLVENLPVRTGCGEGSMTSDTSHGIFGPLGS